jgi:protein arginine kinase
VIEADCGSDPWRACSVRNDGVLSVTVNMEDHLRISSFSTGLSLNDAARGSVGLERELARSLAFSSMSGFGFLASSIVNSGQAMRLSVLLSLSGLCMNGLIERVIREYLAQGFIVRGYYGQRDSASLGCVYQLSNLHSMAPDVDSLVISMEQAAGKLVELERKSRKISSPRSQHWSRIRYFAPSSPQSTRGFFPSPRRLTSYRGYALVCTRGS